MTPPVAQRARRFLQWLRGGPPAVLPPMPGALELGAREERALRRVIRSQRLTRSGNPWKTASEADALERQLAARLGVERSLVVSSGTAALHCALVGLGIGPGDEVIVPAYAWISDASTVCLAGATPVIVDVDRTLTLDPDALESAATSSTAAIVVVHMRGAPARMDRIQAIARRFRIPVIEDVAQAMGGSFHGRPLGTIGDVGCFSMQTYKVLCVGEGGALVARDPVVFQRMLAFHSETDGVSALLALNYGMSELSAAVGRVQLDRLDGMLSRMRRIKARLREALREFAADSRIALREETDPAGDTATCITFFEATPAAADRTCVALRERGIGCSRIYRPGVPDLHVYRHWDVILNRQALSARGGPWRFANREVVYHPDMCPRALDLLSRAVEITILPQYSERDVEYIVRGLREVLGVAASESPALSPARG